MILRRLYVVFSWIRIYSTNSKTRQSGCVLNDVCSAASGEVKLTTMFPMNHSAGLLFNNWICVAWKRYAPVSSHTYDWPNIAVIDRRDTGSDQIINNNKKKNSNITLSVLHVYCVAWIIFEARVLRWLVFVVFYPPFSVRFLRKDCVRCGMRWLKTRRSYSTGRSLPIQVAPSTPIIIYL